MVVFVQSSSVRAKVVVLGQKLLYSGKNGVIWAKLEVFQQGGCFMESDCFRAKLLFLGKVVVIGQSGCISTQWLYSGKSGRIRSKWLYSFKVVVFG